MTDFYAHALETYQAAQERYELLCAEWKRLGEPIMTTGSKGQPIVHPLIGAIGVAARHADRLRQPLLRKHRGPDPVAVIRPDRITPASPAAKLRLARRSSDSSPDNGD